MQTFRGGIVSTGGRQAVAIRKIGRISELVVASGVDSVIIIGATGHLIDAPTVEVGVGDGRAIVGIQDGRNFVAVVVGVAGGVTCTSQPA